MQPDSRRKGILIVEDDPATLQLEMERLRPLGLPLASAAGSEEAINAVRKDAPSLMLLDYSLPEGDALSLLERLRDEARNLPPFVMITGRGDEKVAVNAMKAGALDYLVKDAAFLENLLPTVAGALEKAALREKLKDTELDLRKSVRMYNFLAQVNQAAVKFRDRDVLLAEVCSVAVNAGGMRMAWVGEPDSDIGRVRPLFHSGFNEGYLDSLKVDVDAGPLSQGPTGAALRTGKINVCPDIAADPRMAPWREAALERGYRSSAAVPLEYAGQHLLLNLYSGERDFFDEDMLGLLKEVQGDMALALEGIDLQQKRDAAQAALERTSAQLSHALDSTSIILFKIRFLGGRPVPEWVTGDVAGIMGYDPGETLGADWFFNVVHPEDREKVWLKPGGVGGEGRERDFRIIARDGSTVWLSEKVRPDAASGGECLLGAWTDITEKKKAEIALEENEARLRSMVDRAPYGVAVRRGERVVYINRRGLEIMRAPSEKEVLGRSVLELLGGRHLEDVRARMASVDGEGASTPPLELDYRALDGTPLTLEVNSRPLFFGGEQCSMIFFCDVSARKRGEKMMLEMAAMQRVESLGQLAGGIAHDFNNMLTGIMANVSLLTRRCSGERDVTAILEETLEATRAAQALTASLLAFSKGGRPVKKEFCLRRALSEIFSLATRGASVSSSSDIPEGLWGVNGDENQLKQAVNNLLLNGLQAMPSGGLLKLSAENLPRGSRLPELLEDGDFVRVTVSDGGVGVPEAYLQHIFDPYFTTKSKGHGLGLSMTWSVVKNHGGHISVSSEPGKGTRFEIYLPATGRVMDEVKPGAAPVKKGSGRVLALEDEAVVSGALRRMLGELGYECEIVSDGAEAVRRYGEEAAAGRPFKAVIMDLTIPGGMGGLEAVKRLREAHPEARVIVSSGYSDEAVMSDFRKYGFDAVLPKPYRFEELSEALARLAGDAP